VPGSERRRQILDAAAALFAESGFTGTTTRQIAAAVGISETLLFRHFPSKDALYAASLEDRVPAASVEAWIGELRAFTRRDDDEGLFVAVTRAILESHRTVSQFHRLMLFAALEHHALARRFELAYMRPLGRFLCDYVARRQAEGAFRREPPEVVAHALMSVSAHFAQWKALGMNPLGLTDEAVVGFARRLLDDIRTPPAKETTSPRRSSTRARRP
jgi:TetR/AcrR family transcriptional regulator